MAPSAPPKPVPSAPPKHGVTRCAAHGLAYDPALYSGCIRCRGVVEPSAARSLPDVTVAEWVQLIVGVVLMVAIGGGTHSLVEALVKRDRSEAAAFDRLAVEGAACAIQMCRPTADDCFATCPAVGPRADDACARQCLSRLQACVERCQPPLAMNAGSFAAVIPGESIPAGTALAVRNVVEDRGMALGLDGRCRVQLRRAYVRLAVDGTTGTAREVQTLATPPELGPCVASAFERTKFPVNRSAAPSAPPSYELYAVVKP